MKLRTRIAWVVGATVFALHTVSIVQAQTITVPDSTEVVPAETATPVPTTPASLPPIAEPVVASEPPAVVPAEVVAPDPITPAALSPTEETVIFSDINDAVPGKYFDAATTVPDSLNPNKLIIGFHTGFDADTWTSNTFTASTAAFYRDAAMDTISFLIEAPAGFYIARISYTQSCNGVRSRTGMAAGSVNWVVDYVADDIGRFGENAILSRTVDLTGQNKTIIPVSITNSVFAFATPQLGAATIHVTSAEVLVELLPLLP